jgi:hypothetical protein
MLHEKQIFERNNVTETITVTESAARYGWFVSWHRSYMCQAARLIVLRCSWQLQLKSMKSCKDYRPRSLCKFQIDLSVQNATNALVPYFARTRLAAIVRWTLVMVLQRLLIIEMYLRELLISRSCSWTITSLISFQSSPLVRPQWTRTHQCTLKDEWSVVGKQFSVGFQFLS